MDCNRLVTAHFFEVDAYTGSIAIRHNGRLTTIRGHINATVNAGTFDIASQLFEQHLQPYLRVVLESIPMRQNNPSGLWPFPRTLVQLPHMCKATLRFEQEGYGKVDLTVMCDRVPRNFQPFMEEDWASSPTACPDIPGCSRTMVVWMEAKMWWSEPITGQALQRATGAIQPVQQFYFHGECVLEPDKPVSNDQQPIHGENEPGVPQGHGATLGAAPVACH
ncbi:hypothetical protein CALVIDRAFT_569401 [Calocera viscosa TUFC12733]|uniref:Uncharacterized protein n=1 Tax=Calocera viscosa (strain TUFC12733) TaxID=1330018 RepID=A0A167G008_CALVF|nr:hypothetical protein CALVIDRAFT_569401 [Calocera viscosa TUFC12733]